MQGWIKLHRKLLINPIIKKPELLQLFIYCLLKANHEPERAIFNSKEIVIDKGQFITGRRVLANDLNQKPITIYKRLKNLEKLKILNIKSNNRFSIVTIVNYGFYQTEGVKSNSKSNNKITTREQQDNTNKNDKNDKNKDITHEIKNFRQRYSDFIDLVDEYFEVLRTTRVSGKISDSVILRVYEEMNKYPVIVVRYACKTVVNNPQLHDKKENYFYGIMRNTTAEEASRKLNNVIEIPKSRYRDLTNYEPG